LGTFSQALTLTFARIRIFRSNREALCLNLAAVSWLLRDQADLARSLLNAQ
jgi:hypothetical protein